MYRKKRGCNCAPGRRRAGDGAMTIAPEHPKGAPRWSMASRCGRMAAYGLLGVDPEPPTPREQGRFARGRDTEEYIVRQLIAKHGDGNVIRQKAVPWPAPPALPLGELHSDATIVRERLAVEIKSSEWVDSLFDAAVKQLAGAIHFDPDVDQGVLMFVDRDYQVTDAFPVFVTDEMIEEIEALVSAVAATHDEVPERVCAKPADAQGRMCPFAEHCFAGGARAPELEMPEIAVLATEAYLAKRELDEGKGNLKPLEERYKAARLALLEAGIPAGDTIAGGVLIKH